MLAQHRQHNHQKRERGTEKINEEGNKEGEKEEDLGEKILVLYLSQLSHVECLVTGEDLLRFGMPKGPRYLILLKKLLEAKINTTFTVTTSTTPPTRALCTREDELEMAKGLVERERRISAEKLDIDGKDFLRSQLPMGPLFGKILRKVRIAKLDGRVGSSKEDQLAYAIRLHDRLSKK